MWQFRVAAIGIQAVLWTGFGLVFGHLAERVLEPKPAAESVPGAERQAAAAAQ